MAINKEKSDAALVFPHQLFENPPWDDCVKDVVLYEDPLYFTQYNFHKQKLILHKASMLYYTDYLSKKGFKLSYLDVIKYPKLDLVFKNLHLEGIEKLHITYTDDYLLERRISHLSKKYGIETIRYANPNFIESKDVVCSTLGDKKHYLMAHFYVHQRKKYKILVDDFNNPEGGKWSFDAENRKKVPKGTLLPSIEWPVLSEYVEQAEKYVSTHFFENYGDSKGFKYPIDHTTSNTWLSNFISTRFSHFGTYEDAIVKDESWLWHSVVTPMLNIGLLSPKQIINEVILHHKKKQESLNNVEGFIRQVLGWREFIRGIYHLKGVQQRTNNHFGFTRKIPRTFWSGDTGIEPIDITIKKLLKTGYNHHIERLMVFGNFFLLCEFDPDEVYQWFMEMYVDSYDWVMVPNVYAMTQYADGGLMTTKPYVSSSNYLLKMSDYKRGNWCKIWDALYWRFIYINRDEFSKNHRMRMIVSLLNKMDEGKLNTHLNVANDYLDQLNEA